jgi:hypothetical protein
VAFLAVLSLAVASQSRWLDVTLTCVAWAVFILGSVLIVVRTFKHPDRPPSGMAGQIAILPRSWQRWVLGERDDSK